MGVYSDRHGRKAGLTLSVTLMCLGSLIIALTPGYATIGVMALALLVIARLMQGLSVGGEYGASATYLSEMAGKDRRGFFSSFQYVTLISGQLLAILLLLLLQSVMDKPALEEWGWRIPFAVGAVLAVVVFRLRRGLAETESFKNAKATDAPKSGFLALLRHHPKETALVMLLTAGVRSPSTPIRSICRSSWSTPRASARKPRPRSMRSRCSSSCCSSRWPVR